MVTMTKIIEILFLLVLVFDEGKCLIETYHTSSSGLSCKKCSPGSYWKADCTSDGQQDQCLPCPALTYQPDFNIAHSCAACATECRGNNGQEVRMVQVAPCNSTADLKCACTADFWMEQGRNPVCRSVSSCPPGKGVLKLADEYNNTTCETCRSGRTYSSISSKNEPCQNCSVCGEDQMEGSSCNAVNNTVCVSSDQQNGLSPGAIAGIVVGLVAAVSLATVLVLFWRRSSIFKQLCVRGKACASDKSTKDEEMSLNKPDVATDNIPALFSYKSLLNLARQIGKNWQLIAVGLYLDDATLFHTTDSCPTIEQKIVKMLMRWRDDQRQKVSFEAMKSNLSEALEQDYSHLSNQLMKLKAEDIFPSKIPG